MENSGVTIYDILYTPIELMFPESVLTHPIWSLWLDSTAFVMTWLLLMALAYVPVLISSRLIMKGVKKWF